MEPFVTGITEFILLRHQPVLADPCEKTAHCAIGAVKAWIEVDQPQFTFVRSQLPQPLVLTKHRPSLRRNSWIDHPQKNKRKGELESKWGYR